MILTIDLPEKDVSELAAGVLARRIKERLPEHHNTLRTGIDSAIRAAVDRVVAEQPVGVAEVLRDILNDTLRHQVNSIVRLAVQKELAALKAEVTPEEGEG